MPDQNKFAIKLKPADHEQMSAVAQLMRDRGEPFPNRADVIRYALKAAVSGQEQAAST